MIEVFARTDVGRVREGNEDNFLVEGTTSEELDVLPGIKAFGLDNTGLVLMVSDGMGGAAAGEVASELAVKTAREEMNFDETPSETEYINRLTEALQKANEVIAEFADQNPEMRGMGATATAAGILYNKVYIGQIGDSRAYLVRKGAIEQLTKDQSFVNQLVEAGKITEAEAEVHPRRNVILQALGNQPNLKVAMTEHELEADDYLLLCSDGLSSMVRKEEILKVVEKSEDIAGACNQLVNMANERGGHDNITVLIAHVLDQPVSNDADSSLTLSTMVEDDETRSLEAQEIKPPEQQQRKRPSTFSQIIAWMTSRTGILSLSLAGIVLVGIGLKRAGNWHFSDQTMSVVSEAEARQEQQIRIYVITGISQIQDQLRGIDDQKFPDPDFTALNMMQTQELRDYALQWMRGSFQQASKIITVPPTNPDLRNGLDKTDLELRGLMAAEASEKHNRAIQKMILDDPTAVQSGFQQATQAYRLLKSLPPYGEDSTALNQ